MTEALMHFFDGPGKIRVGDIVYIADLMEKEPTVAAVLWLDEEVAGLNNGMHFLLSTGVPDSLSGARPRLYAHYDDCKKEMLSGA